MPKVICTLPNASELISGVKFEPHERGVISEDISDDLAETFLAIRGYELDGEKKPTKPPVDDAELEELRAKAAALEIKVNGKWGRDRLTAEIEKAEAKKAADAEAEQKAAEEEAAQKAAADEAAQKAADEAANGGAGGESENNA
ncbi:hypothetical protein [Bordetella phage vB_BbrM_PHB04]|uniref:Uncharacterized protein n=1 Tax=Bordetella phage vB_BbrM_PHB04 TaxID=2029657 RepID=A0A291LAJ9_9CAUD|nr:hypothetical protein HOS14_gp019 [Bordetella phage vB_BbrM_PHB04]ATI15637.1 hypothetical protein [Bordetella phage vB_BbrM_PHB04]